MSTKQEIDAAIDAQRKRLDEEAEKLRDALTEHNVSFSHYGGSSNRQYRRRFIVQLRVPRTQVAIELDDECCPSDWRLEAMSQGMLAGFARNCDDAIALLGLTKETTP